ncbi:MAG: hypothetical protein AAFO97_14685 [Pseudomonadota bacterium]
MNYLASNGGEFSTAARTGSDFGTRCIVDGCENVRLYGIYMDVRAGSFQLKDTVDFVLEKTWCDGDNFPANTPNTSTADPGNSECIYIDSTTRTTLKNVHVSHGSRAGIVISGNINVDLTNDGVTSDHLRHDNIKIFTGTENLIMRRLLRCRSMIRLNTQHTDFIQAQGGYHINALLEKCVSMYMDRVNGANSSEQNFFLAGGDPPPVGNGSEWQDLMVRHNVMAANHLNALKVSNPGYGTNQCLYNTIVPLDFEVNGVQKYSSPTAAGFDVYDYNIFATKPNRDRSGPNGIFLDWGALDNNDVDFNQFALSPHFTSKPDSTSGLEWLQPSAGSASRAHPGNANPTGAHEVVDEWFVTPGQSMLDAGWPCGEPANRQYNKKGLIPTTWTGVYDNDAMDTGAAAPAFPRIPVSATMLVTAS